MIKLLDKLVLAPFWVFEGRDVDGALLWRGEGSNAVVNEGVHYMLDVTFGLQAQIAGWYVGLTAASPAVDANDTMAGHAGWTEVTAYTEPGRQGLNMSSAVSRSLSNTGSKAVFTANADGVVVGGAFISSGSAKGSSSGKLFSVAPNAAGNQTLNTGQTASILAGYTLT